MADVASQIQNKVVFYCTGNMSPNQVLSPVMLQSELARSPTYPPPAVKVGSTGNTVQSICNVKVGYTGNNVNR